MRRLLLVALVSGIVGLALYRRRMIDHWEQELSIGRHAGERPPRPPAG